MVWIQSITLRLSLLYGVTTAALLVVVSALLFQMLNQELIKEDQGRLDEKLRAIKYILQTSQANQHALEQEVLLESEITASSILNQDDLVVMQSPRWKAWPVVDKCRSGAERKYVMVHGTYMLLCETVIRADGSYWKIQVASNVESNEILMHHFLMLLLLIVIIGSLIAMIVGYVVTRRGLQPLNDITKMAEKITVTHLHQRLIDQQWPIELQQLAFSLDGMLDRLEDAFQRLSQFSANLAHELRTPLHNLIGQTEVTLAQTRNTVEYQQILGSNLEEYTRLTTILESLLFLARAESEQMSLHKTLFDGRAILDSLCNYQSIMAEEQAVQLSCVGQGLVYADKELMKRAVNNLLSNALKYTSSGGNVQLSVEDTLDASVIIVQDTGKGIAPEYQQKLGQRFFRANVTDTSGYGLGLAIVRSIVHLHDGHMEIDSQQGKGTTVSLYLPK